MLCVCFVFTNKILSNLTIFFFIMFSKVFQNSQSVIKNGDEIIFVFLFVSVITVNKYVLSELKFTVPTVFQGLQTLSCVILLSALIKLKKIQNDLQIIDVKAIVLFLPALIAFTVGIVAGSKALANLPVPVFLAVTSLHPALLVLFMKKNVTSGVSLNVCGSTAIQGLVMIILIYSTTPFNDAEIVWLLVHVFLNLFYSIYLSKLNLDLSHITQIYYRNFFSVIFLFPISLYLGVLNWPSGDWRFCTGCFLSGVLGAFLQMWTFKVMTRTNNLQYEGLAKVISSFIAYLVFFADIEPFIWVLIIINFLICTAVLKSKEQQLGNAESNIIMSMSPPHMKRFDPDGITLI